MRCAIEAHAAAVPDDVALVKKLAPGASAASRADGWARVTSALLEFAKLESSEPTLLSDAHRDIMMSAYTELEALKAWCKGNAGRFRELKDEDFDPSLLELLTLKLGERLTFAVKQLELAIQGVTEKIRESSPPTVLLENKLLLVDKTLQDTLFATDKKALATLLAEATLAQKLATGLATSTNGSVAIDKTIKEQLQESRNHIKTSIGVDYVMSEIVNHQPKDAALLSDWAKNICSKLASKGINTVPKFLMEVLDKLKVVSSAKANAKTGKRGVGEDHEAVKFFL